MKGKNVMVSFTPAEARRLIAKGKARANMHVDGSLFLIGSAFTELPNGLSVGGSLCISGTAITKLPDGLSVGGNLYLHETAITALPDDLVIGGALELEEPSDMAFPTAWYATKKSAQKLRALASDGVYTLLESDTGEIMTACRGPWSRAEALAHWGDPSRTDDRARRFVAAIAALPPVSK